jgi:osmotically inducible protein OsmC
MPARRANATWTGSLKEGAGKFGVGSGAVAGAYTFATRFEEAPGTNPEELIGAAHASCFSMFLAASLGLSPSAMECQLAEVAKGPLTYRQRLGKMKTDS